MVGLATLHTMLIQLKPIVACLRWFKTKFACYGRQCCSKERKISGIEHDPNEGQNEKVGWGAIAKTVIAPILPLI